MTWTKLLLEPFKFAFAISFALVSFTPVQAQRVNQTSNPTPPPGQGQPGGIPPAGTHAFEQPPLDQGAPRRTKPAGDRGPCPVVQKPLTALVPITKESDGAQLRWGLTTKEHPTFWFYVPYELKSIGSAKFSLRNEAGSEIYHTPVTLTRSPGVISISLPPTAAGLEINKWYQSYLFIDISCAPNTPTKKHFAEAWVKREALPPALKSELDKQTTLLQRARFYAKHGIWYEALTTLAELRHTNSKDDEWTKLLQSVELEAIASEPIVNCCTLGKL